MTEHKGKAALAAIVAELEARVAELEAAQGWQSIETAPKED